LAFRLIENAGALDRAGDELDHISDAGQAALKRYGVRLGRHSIFLPALIRPRAAQTLALLWHSAHARGSHAVFLARPGALSLPLDRARPWGERAAAGYRACGRVAVRLDLVERLGEAIDANPMESEATLARIIGRPARELPALLTALGYERIPADGETPGRWRWIAPKRVRAPEPAPDNAFSSLATLLPQETPHRRRRRKRA